MSVSEACPESLWGLPERVVAAESCIFALELYQAALPQMVLVSAAAAICNGYGVSSLEATTQAYERCESVVSEAAGALDLLRRTMYRSQARMAIKAKWL